MFCSIIYSRGQLLYFWRLTKRAQKQKTNTFLSKKCSTFNVPYFFFWKNSRFQFFEIICARVHLTTKLKIIMIRSHCVKNMSHRFSWFSKNQKLKFFHKACSFFFFIFFNLFLEYLVEYSPMHKICAGAIIANIVTRDMTHNVQKSKILTFQGHFSTKGGPFSTY